MDNDLNRDGQPIVRAFNWKRIEKRTIDELIGICKGVLSDGVVVPEEVNYIWKWLKANREHSDVWPASVLYQRIREMLIDGILDADEESELVDLLADLTGGPPVPEHTANAATALPLDKPPPPITFPGVAFCLTGKFIVGSRKQCEGAIVSKGGIVHANPTQLTGFLVIGNLGSRDWMHSTHGRKIERAVTLRVEGHGIRIVSEEHWIKHLE